MAAKEDSGRRGLRKRTFVFGGFGLLVGLLVIAFFSKVYNPFGAGAPDPLVVIPEDADFVVVIPELPRFLREIREKPAVERMRRHAGFQRFLRQPYVERTGIVEAIDEVFAQLDALEGRLPFDLEILGDVSGDRLVVGGYLGEGDRPTDFLLAIQPGSWMTLAGVNVLLDETLSGFGLDTQLEAEGVEIERFRDQVRLRPPEGRDFYLARVADLVLLATDGRHLARIQQAVATHGIPVGSAPRFQALAAPLETEDAVLRLLAETATIDESLDLDATLLELWGPDDYRTVRALLPPVGEGDVQLDFRVGLGLEVALAVPEGSAGAADLSRLYRGFSPREARQDLHSLEEILPADVFGLVRLGVPFGAFAPELLRTLEFLDEEDRELVERSLADYPSIGSLDRLWSTLEAAGGEDTVLAFFRQQREAYPDRAAPGYAVLSRVRNRGAIMDVLGPLPREVARARRGGDGGGAVKALEHSERDGVAIWSPDLASGVVDDPSLTRPALGLANGWFILTNFEPLLHEMRRVRRGEGPALEEAVGLEVAAGYLPRGTRLAGLLDGRTLYPWLRQSAEGWAYERSTPKQNDFVRWRQEIRARLDRRGLQPNEAAWIHEEEAYVDLRARQMQDELPATRREIQEVLDAFEGLIGSLGVFLESGTSLERRVTYRLRLDFAAPDA